MRSKLALFVLGVVALNGVWCGIAAAHVTVSPSSLPQGTDDAILTFRVPNESTHRQRDRTAHSIPVGPPDRGSQPRSRFGMVRSTSTRPCCPSRSRPTTGRSHRRSRRSTGADGSIPVGQFGEFNVSGAGTTRQEHRLLTFKAVQLYSDGTTVSWIQVPTKAAPDPEHPAPTLVLTAPGKRSSGAANATAAALPSAAAGSPAGRSSSFDNGLAIAAVILAAMALAVSVLAVWLGRPRLTPLQAPHGAD